MGPKPIRVMNDWFGDKDFLLFVKEEWRRIVVEGHGDYILKKMLRILKGCVWKIIFGDRLECLQN